MAKPHRHRQFNPNIEILPGLLYYYFLVSVHLSEPQWLILPGLLYYYLSDLHKICL